MPEPVRGDKLPVAVAKARVKPHRSTPEPYRFAIDPPKLMPGVVPAGTKPAIAMDLAPYDYAREVFNGGGFPGYPYLAQLATRAEYRAFASGMSTELTREWIKFTTVSGEGGEKISAISAEFDRLGVRAAIQKMAEHDCLFGRGQIALTVGAGELSDVLVYDSRTVPLGSFKSIANVEPMWTTPVAYNSSDPTAPDFYRPSRWFMLAKEIHATRMLTVITRPLPDMLKPAFNFSGMSLSQLAEPYVDNWLRTRQGVSDLINNFSLTVLATSMDQVLQGNDDGVEMFARADLFTETKSNRGLMMLDKDREEIVQINTPLSGLHELQAQSQEHMCSVSRMPAVVLTGISPSGLNASSEGEIRAFYDWVAAQQDAYYRAPIDVMLNLTQLSLFGAIDPDIGFEFVSLYQMTPAEEAEIRAKDAATDGAYLDHGVISPEEVRGRLIKSPISGYDNLIASDLPEPPEPEPNPFDDDGEEA
jgi:hypothetical protein